MQQWAIPLNIVHVKFCIYKIKVDLCVRLCVQKQWKNKYSVNESQKPPDRSKMTMRDFIYYLPDNNPMT